MRARFRKKKRLDPAALRLPLIALIDVVLFILMYFMVAGTMGSEERELSTSIGVERSGVSGGRSALLPTILRLEKTDGRLLYRLGQRVVRDSQGLSTILNALPKEGGVVIKAGEGVTVGEVAAALQACKDAQFVKISFVAEAGKPPG